MFFFYFIILVKNAVFLNIKKRWVKIQNFAEKKPFLHWKHTPLVHWSMPTIWFPGMLSLDIIWKQIFCLSVNKKCVRGSNYQLRGDFQYYEGRPEGNFNSQNLSLEGDCRKVEVTPTWRWPKFLEKSSLLIWYETVTPLDWGWVPTKNLLSVNI